MWGVVRSPPQHYWIVGECVLISSFLKRPWNIFWVCYFSPMADVTSIKLVRPKYHLAGPCILLPVRVFSCRSVPSLAGPCLLLLVRVFSCRAVPSRVVAPGDQTGSPPSLFFVWPGHSSFLSRLKNGNHPRPVAKRGNRSRKKKAGRVKCPQSESGPVVKRGNRS